MLTGHLEQTNEGWQVQTPARDLPIYIALSGNDAEPAVEGTDPDISAELYTTNGDTDTHMTERYHTLGFTPEMSTCEAASDSVPDDEWKAEDCGSGFEFPDDEELVQAEFESTASTSPTATRRPSRSWPSGRSTTFACTTASTAAARRPPVCPSGTAVSATATRTTTTTPSSAARSAAPTAATT